MRHGDAQTDGFCDAIEGVAASSIGSRIERVPPEERRALATVIADAGVRSKPVKRFSPCVRCTGERCA